MRSGRTHLFAPMADFPGAKSHAQRGISTNPHAGNRWVQSSPTSPLMLFDMVVCMFPLGACERLASGHVLCIPAGLPNTSHRGGKLFLMEIRGLCVGQVWRCSAPVTMKLNSPVFHAWSMRGDLVGRSWRATQRTWPDANLSHAPRRNIQSTISESISGEVGDD